MLLKNSIKIITKKLICFVLNAFVITVAHADNCPAPDEVRERKISGNYEWTVDERISLENVLTVKRLIAVRLINNGEYLSCKYTTEKQLVVLYGLPKSDKCMINVSSGEWVSTDSGELVCHEKNITFCLFDVEC
jgi:hypothetical protein